MFQSIPFFLTIAKVAVCVFVFCVLYMYQKNLFLGDTLVEIRIFCKKVLQVFIGYSLGWSSTELFLYRSSKCSSLKFTWVFL